MGHRPAVGNPQAVGVNPDSGGAKDSCCLHSVAEL